VARVLEKKFLVDEQDKSVGVTLPLRKGNNGYFEVSYTTKDQIKSNIKSLLLTQKGERLMQPTFGSDLKRYLFEPISSNLDSFIEDSIMEAINTWMPYVTVESIIYDTSNDLKDMNRIDLELKYSLKYSNSQTLEQLNIVI
jgi:phage baseplate assembly protein W